MLFPQEAADSPEAPDRPRAQVAPATQIAKVQADLAALLDDDQAVYFRLGPEGAVLSVKGRGTFAFGESFGRRWHEMTPEKRAHAVLSWIRKAAQYCRVPRIRWLSHGPAHDDREMARHGER